MLSMKGLVPVKCVDVNVLLNAADASSPDSDQASNLLKEFMVAPAGLGLFSIVLAGFIRISTDRRIYTNPKSPTQAMEFVDTLLGSPTVTVLNPGARHWEIFTAAFSAQSPRRADVTDVWLATAVMEIGAEWVSYDRGFARFPQLRWVNPHDID
jgi:toxin-antitoxin system PIN domain toxin